MPMPITPFDNSYETRLQRKMSQLRWQAMHLDPYLLLSLFLLAGIGLFILYSAGNSSFLLIRKQMIWMAMAFTAMVVTAQIHPRRYLDWAPWIYLFTVTLLVLVLLVGHVGQGARRWLHIGFFNLQPSEIMKLAMPAMLAWYLDRKPLPPRTPHLLVCGLLLLVPVLLTAKQPDLGTAIIIAISGLSVLILAGLSWRIFVGLFAVIAISTPFLWLTMHGYQKQRVLTFLNPERDPLGSGYHIIQSKIAIGSGGLLGKGWLGGTQSHLSFLPAHATDFIFAVSGEELGLIGCSVILCVLLIVFTRSLYISSQAQSTFARLFAGSLSITFLASAFINIGMVMGLLPVVGVPLPLISYGGSSLVTLLIGFGMIMSIHTHRKLWSS